MSSTPAFLHHGVTQLRSGEDCDRFLRSLRWPDGAVRCPRCGSDQLGYLPRARAFKCYQPHRQQKFPVTDGTIFEKSRLGLQKWLPMVWMLVTSVHGVSCWEIHRAIGVSQKTAWSMLEHVRLAMIDEDHHGEAGGKVEVIETYNSGTAQHTRPHGCTGVAAMPFQVFRYVDEQALGHGSPEPMDDAERFNRAMRKIVGRHLTPDGVAGKVESPPDGPSTPLDDAGAFAA